MGTVERLQARLAKEKEKRLKAEARYERAQRKITRLTDGFERQINRLMDAFEVVPDAVALYDSNDVLQLANSAYLKLFDLTHKDIASNITRAEILRIGIKRGAIDLGGASVETWIENILHNWAKDDYKNRTVKDLQGRWYRLMDFRTQEGDIVSYRVDVTHEMKREEELENARLMAEKASEAKSAFLANMSHEIRTPMNGVIGMADMLSETDMTHEQRIYSNTIKKSGEALLAIINDILDYSKIEAGQMELSLEPFNLEDMCRNVVILLHSQAQHKGLELSLDYDMFLPIWYVGDVGRIRQVLLNLVGNALKFTKQGFVKIRVVGIQHDHDDEYDVHVSVEDSGIGLTRDQLKWVFQEFRQVDQLENRKLKGTGLGLSICDKLISKMSGEIWVESELDAGSVFGFRIPLSTHPTGEKLLATIKKNQRRVILVGDEPKQCDLLNNYLELLGWEISVCSTPDHPVLQTLQAGKDMVIVAQSENKTGANALVRKLREGGFEGEIILRYAGENVHVQSPDFDASLQNPCTRTDIYAAFSQAFENTNQQKTAKHEHPKSFGSKRKIKILLAEDNRTNQVVFEQMVKHQHVDLTIAADGQIALAKYADIRPDIIFMDITMPNKDGIVTTKEIRSYEKENHNYSVPIIALTAHAMQGDRDRFLASGMDDYLSKPLQKKDVLAMIEHYAKELLRKQ